MPHDPESLDLLLPEIARYKELADRNPAYAQAYATMLLAYVTWDRIGTAITDVAQGIAMHDLMNNPPE